MSNLALVTDNMLPVANETFIDNLSAGISAGAAIVPINSLAEYADGDSVVLTVDPGTASQATFIGEKQGNTVIDCKWTEGNVGASHAAGATVIDYDSATHYNVVTKLLRMFANENGSLKTTAVQAALNISSAVPADYTPLANAPSATYLGDRFYQLIYPGVNYADRLSPDVKMRLVRTTAAPDKSTYFNGTNQYWTKVTPNKMAQTDNITLMQWVKPDKYQQGYLQAKSNVAGTDGWRLYMNPDGTITVNGNGRYASTNQLIPLNDWTHIAVTLSMSTSTANFYINGNLVTSVALSGTGASWTNAGNYSIGASSGGAAQTFFSGNMAQVAYFSSILTAGTIRNYISQGLVGNEPTLQSAYSFNGVATDLNTVTPNDLTANGGVTANATSSPFGTQGSGSISTTVDYAKVISAVFGTDTTVVVQVPSGNTIPTTGTIASTAYSGLNTPYNFPANRDFMYYADLKMNGLGGPGEYVYARYARYNVASIPVGSRFTVNAAAFGADANQRAVGVKIEYGTKAQEQRVLAAYHNSAGFGMTLEKVSGVDEVIVSYGGNVNMNVYSSIIQED